MYSGNRSALADGIFMAHSSSCRTCPQKNRRHTQSDTGRVAGFGIGNVGCMNRRETRMRRLPR
jgi:hypothetical protein